MEIPLRRRWAKGPARREGNRRGRQRASAGPGCKEEIWDENAHYEMCIRDRLMWMAEQINNYGIGNGISVILFAGIVARAPSVLSNMISYVKYGQLNIFVVLGIAVVAVLLVALVVLVKMCIRDSP